MIWQPMETAPQTGEWILVWDARHIAPGRPTIAVVRWRVVARGPDGGAWVDKDGWGHFGLTAWAPIVPPDLDALGGV